MIADLGFIAFKNLKQRQKRTVLTLIGIIIGIAAVVSLLSLGQGMKKAINDQFSAVGGDKVIIQAKSPGFGPPGSTSAGKITQKDAIQVARIKGVDQVGTRFLNPATIEFNNQIRNQFITTIPDDNPQASALIIALNRYKLESGRWLKTKDQGKVMVGFGLIGKENFGKPLEVGSKLSIKGKKFEIVGLLGRLGDPARNKAVVMNQRDAWDLFGIHDEEVSVIVAQVQPGEAPLEIAQKIQKGLRKYRSEKEGRETIEVQTSNQLITSFNTILNIVQAVLIGIALISLLVGGIGIMNTMYTAALEQTREIGVMKAIGARNSHILQLFLYESGFLGMTGGILGIGAGIGLSKLVEFAATIAFGESLVKAYFPLSLVLGALAFSFFLGVISGMLPAWRASTQKPVEALRYE